MSAPKPQTAAEMAEEIKLLRLLVGSAVAHILDLTDCLECGDVPDQVDAHISIPKSHLMDARGAAGWIARRAGVEAD